MPLQATAGAATYDAFGGGVATAANYIEDVFQTWLYTGNGSTQTITNGVDLAGKGGLVWYKDRTSAFEHQLVDTARGAGFNLETPNTTASTSRPTALTAFTTTGFTLGSNAAANGSGDNFVSWTFRKQPKFFDVVTYTGTGSNTTISHNLGAVPGCIIVKRTDASADWQVYHRSNANTEYMVLNSTAASATGTTRWNSTTPTSTVFSLGTDTTVNASGGTYVAYLFAHDAGGFGASGTDNVISCGSYTGNGSATGPTVTLNYEPQWLMVKNSSGTGNWNIIDNMRGMPVGSADAYLEANTSDAEASTEWVSPTATGFQITSTSSEVNTNASAYIYIAIRRGPMKTPTSGTSVFAPSARSGTGATGSSTALGNVTDLTIIKQRGSTETWAWTDRLRGATRELTSAATTAETAYSNDVTGFDSMTGFLFGTGASGQVNSSGSTYVDLLFRRAPGFFDVVCYTSDNTYAVINHNLGVVPQLVIQKRRNGTSNWFVTTGAQIGYLELTDAFFSFSRTFTSTTFEPATTGPSYTYVVYLFATVAGVSKVGSYTGTAALLTVNCGFTAGARFVLIKRTDSTGDWYVYDSARGISSGNDPYLLLNSSAAEVTGTNYVDTDTTGFKVTAAAPAGLNANGGTYLFLAVA